MLFSLLLACGLTSAPTLVDHGFRQMYNLQFAQAHVTFAAWQRSHPADPLGPVADAAAYLFAEFDRLRILQAEFFTDDTGFFQGKKPSPDPAVKLQFLAALSRSEQLITKALLANPKDPDALFADVLRRGLHADYLGLVEKNYLDSLREMKAGRLRAEQLLQQSPACYDAYVAVGTENYMLSQKPMPVRWVLRLTGARTDKDEGLRQLANAAEKGRYLLPFAKLLQAVAALRDNDTPRAKALLDWLIAEFPQNRLYAQERSRLR